MGGKYFCKALIVKAKRLCKVEKKLAKSYIAIFLVLVLILTSSFAWFTISGFARPGTNFLDFNSSSLLRIDKSKSSATRINIPAFTLDEASSVDGRNIYFPLGASFTNNTGEMFFREGNAGDKNVHYVYKDFQLDSFSGDTSNTPVYIKSYEIKVEEAASAHDSDVNATYSDTLAFGYTNGKPISQIFPPEHCPIRLAFITDSATDPVVIDPSAWGVGDVDNSAGAVDMIDDNGVPKTKATNSKSFASYYYGSNNPLFVIPQGGTLAVTLVVWLEGTLPDCDKYIGKNISIDIDIESNFIDMEPITFVDDTQSDSEHGSANWVGNDDAILVCSYEDPYSDETPKRWKTAIMTKGANNTWTANISKKALNNIAFYRIVKTSGSKNPTIYNAWYTTGDVNLWVNGIPDGWYVNGELQTTRRITNGQNSVIYTAVHGNGSAERLSPCIGYWVLSE